jgi:hypothetical protein
MKYAIKKKLEVFLNQKMKEILIATRNDSTKSVESVEFVKVLQTGEINGYKAEYSNDFDYWQISKKPDCHIDWSFNNGKRSTICLYINEVYSLRWYSTPAMLYKCLDEFDGIETEFFRLLLELEKQNKINEIAKNSILTWLKEILKPLPYSYYTTETEHKITLSIKLKRSTQLDIPIYYSRFQSIMPHIEKTIREYEAMANGSKIKMLITNSAPLQVWKPPLNS